MSKKCPICESETDYKSYGNEHGLEEEHITCPNKCYCYEFVYGNTRYYVGNIVLEFCYSDSPETQELVHKQLDAVIKLEKEFYKKEKLNKISNKVSDESGKRLIKTLNNV